MKNFIEVFIANSLVAINVNFIESIKIGNKGQTIISMTSSIFYINESYESICEKIRNAQR